MGIITSGIIWYDIGKGTVLPSLFVPEDPLGEYS